MEELTYERFLEVCDKIIARLGDITIENIYGIPRGGLVLATYLSYRLDIPLKQLVTNDKTLIVDDIVDTGKTLNYINAKIQPIKCFTASIYYHRQSIIEPDIWLYEKKDEFVKFPWETEETARVDYENGREC